MKNLKLQGIVFIIIFALCALPLVTAPFALLAGILFALFIGNPYTKTTQKLTHTFLQFSVIGLGFGMNAAVALQAGKTGFIYTVVGISFTFLLGFIISRMLKIDKKISFLISAGTAICGGSAIAAVAPVIEAKSEETSVALGVVFVLNSVALILFPLIGHLLKLNETQFGIWAAIAIHDTSSVVGASSNYGKTALAVATTIKLTRALWIIPVTLISGFVFKSGSKKVKIPYFIFVFFIAMLCNTYFTSLHSIFQVIFIMGRQGLVITLFLIGANISRNTIKNVGAKPFVMGILLWIIISSLALLSV